MPPRPLNEKANDFYSLSAAAKLIHHRSATIHS